MRKQRILSRMLLALMLVTIISTVFQPNIAYADITDVWQSAGGQGKATSKAATSNGVWINKKQGFRITVLDYIGEPAFTYCGKDHLDLVFNYPAENYSFYGINHKTGQNRMVADNIDELKNNGWATSYVISIGDTYEAFKNGTFQTAAPGDVKKAIENFGNLPYHLWADQHSDRSITWNRQGTKVKAKMYGTSETEIDPSAALFAILNAQSGGGWLWKPKGTMMEKSHMGASALTLAEAQAMADGTITPMELMASKSLVISVEPIIWNQLRISKSQFSKYSVYGTQTDIGYICDKLIEWGEDFAYSDGGGKNGGYDWSLFGKQGRKAMVTTKTIIFKPGGKDRPITPPIDDGSPVNNKTVMVENPGWSLHLYQLKSKDTSTHTWDEPNYPDPEHYEEHPAPDPTTDPPTKDKVLPGSPLLHYRIVKTYEQEIMMDDGSKIVEHVTTKTRIPTIPKITIEDEIEPGGYEVIEWKYGPEYYAGPNEEEMGQDIKAPELPETTPWDTTVQCENPSTRIEKVPKAPERSGDDTAVVDIENKEDKSQIVTLYVQLRKPLDIPETSTTPNDPTPKSPPTPPPNPFDPNEPDPETDIVEEGNPFAHYRIVKVYETYDKEDDTITTDYDFTRYPTNPIVYIEDEGPDPGYSLIEWLYGDEYNYGGPESTQSVPNGTDWDVVVAGVNAKKSGHGEERVDLIDYSDLKKVVTLYVRYRREVGGQRTPGQINIEQSQISKAIHTNDKVIGGENWGKYKFIPALKEVNPKYHTVYCSGCRGNSRDGYWCPGYRCNYFMGTDTNIKFIFGQTTNQDELEIKTGVNTKTDPKVYSKAERPFDITSLSRYEWTFISDGHDQDWGEDYVTVLWRGTTKQNYRDIPTLALYKKEDIEKRYGNDNYSIPNSMLKNADRKSRLTRASAPIQMILDFRFGIKPESDLYAEACCSGVHISHLDTIPRNVEMTGGTEKDYQFKADVAIQFYAGKAKATAIAGATQTRIKVGKHAENNLIQSQQTIKFFPYIRMTYMLNVLTDAEGEEKNTYETGYVSNVRKDTYVLSEHESSLLPSDAAELRWENPKDKDTLKMTSQQWSTHAKATKGSDGWQGPNQVLPGGAIYQLSTPEDSRTHVHVTTYQTVVDQKARDKYLTATNTLSGTEYTVDQVVKDHQSLVNDGKEVLDNLKIVQWVTKKVTNERAWPSDAEGGRKHNEETGDVPINGYMCLLHKETQTLNGKLDTGLNAETSPDSKYYLRKSNETADRSGNIAEDGKLASYKDSDKLSENTKTQLMGQSQEEQNKQTTTMQGDLDIISVTHDFEVYKVFTDTSGYVYIATITKGYGKNDTSMDNSKADIENAIAKMKDINADTYAMGQTYGVTVYRICDKKVAASQIVNYLSSYKSIKIAEDRTKFFSTVIASLLRNKGDDPTAAWSNKVQGDKGTWYNEAFDGIYLVKQHTDLEIGFQFSEIRVSVLDPTLCPQNKGQADLYTKAYLSQFCCDNNSDAEVAQGKPDGFFGNFKGQDLILPDMADLYSSKKFYIPNSNVQDLS